MQAYRQLVEQAEEEKRIILTQDVAFVRQRYTGQVYLLPNGGHTIQDLMRKVFERFGLQVSELSLLSRCQKCNGTFHEHPATADELPAGHNVPDELLKRIDAYWVCQGCSQVYWEGSKFDRALHGLIERFSGLEYTGQRHKSKNAKDFGQK